MKSSDLWQVRLPPGTGKNEAVMKAVQEAIARDVPVKVKRTTMLKILLMHVVHPIGIHHWVGYRTFDLNSGRIIIWTDRDVCALCDRGRIL